MPRATSSSSTPRSGHVPVQISAIGSFSTNMATMTDRKSPIEQALDLFFYAPLGFVLNAQEVVPELIEKGHQQVMAARMFGKFAVENEAPKQIAELQKQVQKVAEQFRARATPAKPSNNGPTAPAT